MNIQDYNPFDLFLFDRSGVSQISWDGEIETRHANPEPFKTSSGFGENVIKKRQEMYDQQSQSEIDLQVFHQSHKPKKSELSICMHRLEAATLSYTQISVHSDSSTMQYTDGPPCKNPLGEPLLVRP